MKDTKNGYTVEEIQEWFLHGNHNKKMIQPLERQYQQSETKATLDRLTGIFLHAHNTIIILRHGLLHNPLGPAKVMVTKEGKPFHSIFARDGKIIQWDGFEAKVRRIHSQKVAQKKQL